MTGMDANQGGATPWADFDAAQAKLIKTVEDETTAAVRPAYDAGAAEAQAKKLSVNFARAAPHFAFGFGSHAYQDSAIKALMNVVGVELPVAGGGAGQPGMPGAVISKEAGAAPKVSAIGQSAMGFVLCWPTVHVAGAFCSGLTPEEDSSCHGVVTKRRAPRDQRDRRRAAFDVYRRYSATAPLGRVIVPCSRRQGGGACCRRG